MAVVTRSLHKTAYCPFGPIFLLASMLVLPLGAFPLPEPYHYDNWQREDGLPQITVNALAQDRYGYLWIGTEEGLVRFDGAVFEVFDRRNKEALRSHVIRSLLTAPDGRLWIGTRNGLHSFADGGFTVHLPPSGHPHFEVLALHLDHEGRLWLGSEEGLSRFDDGTFSSYTTVDGLTHATVQAIAEGPPGVLWVATRGGLSRFEDGRFRTYTTADGLGHDDVRALQVNQQGRLWAGTFNGLSRLDGERFVTYLTDDGLADPTILALYEDPRGDLWIGTESGVNRMSGDHVTVESRRYIPLERQVMAFLEDLEGSFWFGTGSIGLLRRRRSRAVALGTPEGLADDLVWTILENRSGVVWVGTNNGLSRLDEDGTVTNYTPEDGLPGPDVRALLEDRDGHLWIGTERNGLGRFDGDEFHTYSTADGDDSLVQVLAEDPEDGLWIGSSQGLSYFAGDEWTAYTDADGLPNLAIWDLVFDGDGVLWVGTAEGLCRFEGDRCQVVALTETGPEPFVKALHHDSRGALWIGTAEHGVFRWHAGEVHRITVRDGLFDSLVHRILEDDHGRLWMSSNNGVFHLDLDELEDFVAGHRAAVTSVAYREIDGMRSREANGRGQPAGFKTADGRLWFPTIRGVSIFDPARLEIHGTPPPVHIKGVLIDKEPLGDTLSRRPIGGVEIPPGTREIEFRYTAVTFLHPEKVLYRYKLEGFDDDWTTSTRRSERYTNLKPGPYCFRVMARNSDGVWNEDGDSFELTLRPTFRQTWLFYLLCGVVAVLLGRGVHHLRVRQLLKRNVELDRMKSRLEAKNSELERFTYTVSHDLKSPLFTIEGFLGLAEKDARKGDFERLDKDMKQIRNAIGKMRELLDELLELSRIGRLVNPAEEISLFELAREAVELNAGRIAARDVEVEIGAGLGVVTGDRRRLLQVLLNLVDNAVKYMGDQEKPRIEIGGRDGADEITVFVRDNGVGIDPRFHEKIFGLFDQLDPRSDGTGIGLTLIERIIDLHGGRIWVESQGEGQGSTFSFTLPKRGRPQR